VAESHLHWRHVLSEAQKKELLTGVFDRTETATFYRNLFDAHPNWHDINRISLIDMRHFFIDDLMVKNDRTFLANSVEGTVPVLRPSIGGLRNQAAR
jgi:hypothetical protein